MYNKTKKLFYKTKKIENRGRKSLLGENLSEIICFHVTKSQKKRLDETLKKGNVSVSVFLRALLFSD